ncbi:MAG: chemotaxis protein CheW [Coriobacteriia bacterium]|nr:chemotaxis protein CheW [Coriobacteriia bacterium]
MSPRKSTSDGPAAGKRRKSRAPSGERAGREPAAAVAEEVPAAPGEPAPTAPSPLLSERLVVFRLEGQRYALPIECVQEIQHLVAYTDVPDPMPALVGMVNLRGVVVPLVDLRILLGMEPRPFTLETPMIIGRLDEALVALAVDEVEDVVSVTPGCVQDPPRLHALTSKMLGVCRMEPDLVFVLDLRAVVPDLGLVAGDVA